MGAKAGWWVHVRAKRGRFGEGFGTCGRRAGGGNRGGGAGWGDDGEAVFRAWEFEGSVGRIGGRKMVKGQLFPGLA